MTSPHKTTTERTDFAETLAKHRFFPAYTARDLTDDQAAERTTASELTIDGLIKHVASVESGWVDFIVNGPSAMASASADWNSEDGAQQWLSGF